MSWSKSAAASLRLTGGFGSDSKSPPDSKSAGQLIELNPMPRPSKRALHYPGGVGPGAATAGRNQP